MQTVLKVEDIHQSLSDPILESMDFLNEIMDRYPDAISFGPGAPHMGLFEDLDIAYYLSVYTKYLSEIKNLTQTQINRRLYQYGPSQGQINDLIAEALKINEGIEVCENDIVVTVGCQEALILTLRTLFPFQKGGRLAVANPSYVGIVGAARSLDLETLPINEIDESLDLGFLAKECQKGLESGNKIRAIYTAPNFSNPSGMQMNLEAREKLLSLAFSYNFLIIEDDAYGFTAEEHNVVPSLKALDKHASVIHVGTFAKTCLPGARVGFVVADQRVQTARGYKTLANHLASLKSMVTVNTSPICQAIIAGMLIDNNMSLKALSSSKRNFYRENLTYLLAMLEKYLKPVRDNDLDIRWNTPKGGFFVTLKLPFELTELDLLDSAKEYGVLWTPMSFFYLDNSGHDEIRLSCSYLDTTTIEKGISRLSSFLKSRHQS